MQREAEGLDRLCVGGTLDWMHVFLIRFACALCLCSILLDAADLDKDGRIGLEDFRQLSDAAMLQNEQVGPSLFRYLKI